MSRSTTYISFILDDLVFINASLSRVFVRIGKRNKERMKIRAITFLGVAGVEYVPRTPSGAALVILHVGEDVLVDSTGFCEIRVFSHRHLRRKLRGQAGNGYEFICS